MNFHNLSELDYNILNFCSSFCVFINSFLIFYKTQKIKASKIGLILVIIINIIISVLFALLNSNTSIVQIISFVGIALSFVVLVQDNKTKALLIGFISISFAHVFKIIALLLTGTVMWAIQIPLESTIPNLVEDIISIIITFLFLRIKRFRNGIQFFEKEENLGLGLVVSGIVFMLTTVDFGAEQKSVPIIIVFVLGIFISGFGLYLWIRKGITRHYREKLQLKSDIFYKEQLEQKEHEIEQLNQSNEFLAKIVHRDNHLMNSLNSSINSYFVSGDKEFKDDLLREIQTLATERGEIIKAEQREAKLFPTTGNTLIDGAVNDLYIKAAAHGIDFSLTVSATVDEVIGKYISQTDLQTLICDHIKDAIIAVDAKNETNGKILVDLAMQDNNYAITIFDSGVDFEIDTLAKLGRECITTHADNGGSGIGFMTSF